MNERPILFSAPMVRGLLNDSKTKTRRVMKRQWLCDKPDDYTIAMALRHCPYGLPGDRLWVKETWTSCCWNERDKRIERVCYGADGAFINCEPASDWNRPKASLGSGWVTPLFMPRWASRLTLELLDVRVERLQEISFEDVLAEGIVGSSHWPMHPGSAAMQRYDALAAEHTTHIDASTPPDVLEASIDQGWDDYVHCAFSGLWDAINADRGYGWDLNPWVWVLNFQRVVAVAA
jgi:hypothetical protein